MIGKILMHNLLPKARTTDILEQEAGAELMIYDLRVDKAFSLNETSKMVYKACGREISFEELKRASDFTDDLIHLTLGELQKNGLLETDYASPFAGMSRREIIRRVGLSSIAALPVISLLVAPPASYAASGCGGAQNCPCSASSQCAPPASCCVMSAPAPTNGTCQPNNGAVGLTGVCGNNCTCISNCCAGSRCVAPGSVGSGSACTIGCQCSSGNCTGGRCT